MPSWHEGSSIHSPCTCPRSPSPSPPSAVQEGRQGAGPHPRLLQRPPGRCALVGEPPAAAAAAAAGQHCLRPEAHALNTSTTTTPGRNRLLRRACALRGGLAGPRARQPPPRAGGRPATCRPHRVAGAAAGQAGGRAALPGDRRRGRRGAHHGTGQFRRGGCASWPCCAARSHLPELLTLTPFSLPPASTFVHASSPSRWACT